ncbi:UNKNOWN [Stylonychia lemnae]|uniref:PITH domain-containing protein n=1 Tax=Stylonychia lemnae TaxID=5949 RepID=A0A078BAQ3_STYLE|nr:UNKNOWN [Stylonychia lemnae]|eukprot:CDW90648.1 UNKNOWN [Stylonychia lemnae]
MNFSQGVCQSGYGKDLVIYIPFNGEIKVKAIIVIGGDEGTAPSKMKLYKNVSTVDINIMEEKKPLQIIDMNENMTGELEYLLNVSQFNNTSNIVIGFDENFGAKNTVVKYIGLKGEKLREKVKVVETVYEVRANLADHKTEDQFMGKSDLGM